MSKAIIYFSDKSKLELHEKDLLIPILSHRTSEEVHACMDMPIELYDHIKNGLIPSIMDVFCKCNFFYVNNNYDVVYNANAIVKIEVV